MYLGRWEIDDLLTFAANTHNAATGAATDGDGVPTYRIYEDETGTAILTGSMAKLDDANTTGFYSEQITLSAANGFEVGKSYTVYISATVNSVVGTMHHTFQVEDELASIAELNAEIDTAISDANLATAANLADVDTIVDAIKVVTDALTAASAAKLAVSASTIVVGEAEAGTLSSTQMTTNLTEATDDHYIGRVIIWTSGALLNQATEITDYAGSNGLLTFTAVTEAPNATDTFVII